MNKLFSKLICALFLILAFPQIGEAAFTANKLYNNQTTGSNVNTWGIVLNSNFSTIDLNLGGTLTLSVAGSSNVNISTSQAQNLIYDFTGALTGNINVIFPAQGGLYYISNKTSGAFSLTIQAGSSVTGVSVPQGGSIYVVVDNSTSPPTLSAPNYAFAGANSNITSILGLTTPLSIAQGGTTIYSGTFATGTANALTLPTLSPNNFTLTPGSIVIAAAGSTNTGSATLSANGTTATLIVAQTSSGLSALSGGEMIAAQVYMWYYDGVFFELLNASQNANITSFSLNTIGAVQGDILYRGASSWLAIAPGTSGQFFQTQGASANPQWATVSTPVAYNSMAGNIISSISGNHTTASLSVGSGQASNSANSAYITSAGYSWAASNGNAINGTDAASSTLANSTTYHVFLCSGGSGTGTFVSSSLTPTFPAGYTTSSRRIGSFVTDSSGNPIPYKSIEASGGGTINYLTTQTLDVNVSNLGSSRTLYTLNVPSGINVQPIIRADYPGASFILFTSGDETDVAPNANPQFVAAPGSEGNDMPNSGSMWTGMLTTNTSGQIGARSNTTGQSLQIVTRGWIDFRRN